MNVKQIVTTQEVKAILQNVHEYHEYYSNSN